MKRPKLKSHPRLLIATTGAVALVGAAAAGPSAVGASASPGPLMARHVVIAGALDNPRQLTMLESGDFLVAEAGHGGKYCSSGFCVGATGKVTRVQNGVATHVMTGLLSAAGKDGTFAIGSDGADRQPKGPYLTIETYLPPEQLPPGLPVQESGKLIAKYRGDSRMPIADIAAFEQRNNPDGEGVDTNPYAVLALNRQTLVADAAGNDILSVQNGHVSLWAVLPESQYGPRIDAVPTSLSAGPDGKIYVGELHSEIAHKARVWQYDREGNRLRSWTGFTTITGVARGNDGSLYVSELFGGVCTFDRIPTCFPGRVVKVAPDGTRTHVNVPFPAGIVADGGKIYVNAFSVSPATGFGGNPEWAGQLWQVFP